MAALQAFVFVVGGGNYIEYQNLQDYCRRLQNTRRVTYGTSELMNAKQFLTQVGSFLHSLTHPPTHLSLTQPPHPTPSPNPLTHHTLSLSRSLSLVAGRTGKKWRIGDSSDHSCILIIIIKK